MALDPELLKQLIQSFSTELTEHTQTITNGLLALEKNNLNLDERDKTIAAIFRAGHNIKGTARSLGINDVSEIAHRIESIFSALQKKLITITPEMIDLCLEAVDKMHIAFKAFADNEPLSFNLEAFITHLETSCQNNSASDTKTQPIAKEPQVHEHLKFKVDQEHESVRVPIAKIDKVSSLLEEFQVNKIAIDDHYAMIMQLLGKSNDFSHIWQKLLSVVHSTSLYQAGNDCLLEMNKIIKTMQKNMRSCVNELSILSHALQDEVRTLRMIPIGNLLCTFPRYIRDLSQELHKKVELTIIGSDIKLDKLVLEGLKDPMVHLLRNAVDHGIESADVRQSKGKPEVGNITIEIKEEGSQVLISITDDGAGIDSKKVAALAESKHYISQENLQVLTENEILQFIFHPGFSTSDIITDVSGRGFGLDVVKSNIEELKGKVHVSTTRDQGSTFTLVVPLTISSERGLLIKCANQLFVIPTTSVQRVLLTNVNDIVYVQGGQAINLDKQTIPLRILSHTLQLEQKTLFAEDQLSIVVVKKGQHAVAFLIDDVIGEREIVLKTLQAPLGKVKCVAGGTLLESNQVVIVLDPGEILDVALQKPRDIMIVQPESEDSHERPHILVVDDSITTRTLEKNVLESKNYQVTLAVNGKEAWDMLQKQKFSLLITDVMMPVMDGFTLTDRVKNNANLRHLPVIIVTSLGSEAEKKRGIEVGADAYIVKNEFESEALLNVVSQLI